MRSSTICGRCACACSLHGKTHAPETPPGSTFHYANLGYIIAGAMIEKAADTHWEELITRRIFARLGLRTAGLGAQATMGKLDAPVGHKVSDKGEITPMLWGDAADAAAGARPGRHRAYVGARLRRLGRVERGRRQARACAGERRDARAPASAACEDGQAPERAAGHAAGGRICARLGRREVRLVAAPVLTHNGSNGMNLAKILVDPAQDLGVVVLTNFPEDKAEAATSEVIERLYREYGGKADGK